MEVIETPDVFLNRLRTTNTCTDSDCAIIESFMQVIGFPKARVVLGLVYPEGKGEPISIHIMADIIYKKMGGQEVVK